MDLNIINYLYNINSEEDDNMKNYIFFLIVLLMMVGCIENTILQNSDDNTDSEKEIADSIINKLQSQDKVDLTEEEDQYVKNIMDKIHNGEELTEYEKQVNQQFGMTNPSKFLPNRDID